MCSIPIRNACAFRSGPIRTLCPRIRSEKTHSPSAVDTVPRWRICHLSHLTFGKSAWKIHMENPLFPLALPKLVENPMETFKATRISMIFRTKMLHLRIMPPRNKKTGSLDKWGFPWMSLPHRSLHHRVRVPWLARFEELWRPSKRETLWFQALHFVSFFLGCSNHFKAVLECEHQTTQTTCCFLTPNLAQRHDATTARVFFQGTSSLCARPRSHLHQPPSRLWQTAPTTTPARPRERKEVRFGLQFRWHWSTLPRLFLYWYLKDTTNQFIHLSPSVDYVPMDKLVKLYWQMVNELRSFGFDVPITTAMNMSIPYHRQVWNTSPSATDTPDLNP